MAPFVWPAIMNHLPISFAFSSILVRARVRAVRVVASVAALDALVGVGTGLYLALRKLNGVPPGELTPHAVRFDAGCFLHVAITDLPPDLHIGGKRGRVIVAALVA